MNKKPLVTLFIPSFNHDKYVEKAVISACEQTYENIEVLVIDDGSLDNSHELLSPLQQKYNFIYIRQENKGLINTLNEALTLAKGDYFSWCGSDDIFFRDKVEKQIAFFHKNPHYALCYGKMKYINTEGIITGTSKTKHNASGMVFNKLIFRCFVTLPTVMVKTNILKEFGFDKRFFLEDYPLWLKISKHYPIGFLDEELTYYRLHDKNVSGDLVKMIREVERILSDWKDEKIYKKALAKWYFRWFCDLTKTENFSEMREYMLKALPNSFYKPRFLRSLIRYYLKVLKNEK